MYIIFLFTKFSYIHNSLISLIVINTYVVIKAGIVFPILQMKKVRSSEVWKAPVCFHVRPGARAVIVYITKSLLPFFFLVTKLLLFYESKEFSSLRHEYFS
jgi:hypothetical protein